MKGLAEWLTSRYYRAAVLAAALTLVSPLGLVASGTLVLVSLQRGGAAGWRAATIAAALLVGLGLAIGVGAGVALTSALLFWAPPLLLATVLRWSGRLGPVIEVAAIGAMGLVFAWFGAADVVEGPLLDQLAAQMEPLLAGRMDAEETRTLLTSMLPGLMALSLTLSAFISLLLGMWWHAAAASPGSLGTAFREMRMSRTMGAVGLGVLAVTLATGSTLWVSLTIALTGLFVLQGLAMLHGLAAIRGWPTAVLGVVYVLLIFGMFTAPLLAALGLADSWLDFRGRAARAT